MHNLIVTKRIFIHVVVVCLCPIDVSSSKLLQTNECMVNLFWKAIITEHNRPLQTYLTLATIVKVTSNANLCAPGSRAISGHLGALRRTCVFKLEVLKKANYCLCCCSPFSLRIPTFASLVSSTNLIGDFGEPIFIVRNGPYFSLPPLVHPTAQHWTSPLQHAKYLRMLRSNTLYASMGE